MPLTTVHELGHQGTFFFVLRSITDGGRARSPVRGGELLLRTRGIIASRSVNMVRYPRGSYSYIVIPIAVFGSGHTGN